MCYFLSLATPLTLSEVRAMLPPGLTAQPVDSGEAAAIRALHPTAQTVAVLLVGGCSCDLVRPREADTREDERHLRARYFGMGLSRDRIIRELERHRRGGDQRPAGPWAPRLAALIAEHARNAGPTLYLLRFEPVGARRRVEGPVTRTVAEVRSDPEGWLVEDRPVLVVR